MSPIILSILAVVLISFISIVLLYLIIARVPRFAAFSLSIVGVAVGGLLGDAFLHILPEANRQLDPGSTVPLLIILGIILFFSLEKIVRWRHCHDPDCHESNPNHIITISLTGEAFHNFIDGVIIASSFMVDYKIGLATSLAVLIHEIPQEIGDFGIYLHQGLTLKKSLFYNLLSAVFALLGVIATFLLGSAIHNISLYILPVTAGGFIYLAASDLIPELHRHQSKITTSLIQIFLVIVGVALMLALKYFE